MSDRAGEAGLLNRVDELGRPVVSIVVDGRAVAAREGDTLLTAILACGVRLRESEHGDGPRAGFCLMGACQDCWVRTEDGRRMRACGTPVVAGMRIITRGAPWLGPA